MSQDEIIRGEAKTERIAVAKEKAAPRTYVVQAGDSLSKIAGELLGNSNRWPEIFEANKEQIQNPNAIQVGQELVIPDK